MDSFRQAWGIGFVFTLVDVGKTSQWFIGRSYVRNRADGAPDNKLFDVVLATGKEGPINCYDTINCNHYEQKCKK